MPGVVGVCDFRRDGEELGKLLDRMSSSLCHESWYHTGTHVSAPLAMGCVNLGLLGPATQPIFSEDRTRCIVLDGELYDYEPLKAQLRARGYRCSIENDAEFLLYWYEERGIEGLSELNGSFALAIWDSRTRTVTLASDRYGLRPLYYTRRADCLLFASEVKALLTHPLLAREIDCHAVADFFAFQMLLGDKTFFSEIRVLPPASALTFGQHTWAIKRYWDFTFCEEPAPVDEQAVVTRLDELLQSAVNRRMDGDLTVGVFLSGGLDSRTLVEAVARQSSCVHTLTMGSEGCYDMRFARQIAETVQTEHHTLVVRPEAQAELIERGVWLTDGMMNCIHMSILNLLPLARSYVDVVIDGLGGDATLGGHYLSASSFNAINDEELVQALFARFNTGISPAIMPDFFTDHFLAQVKGLAYESMREEVRQAPPQRLINKNEYVYLRNRQRRFIFFGPAMTRSQVESRAPFYDNDFIEFVCSLPAEIRRDQRLHHRLLVSYYPKVAALPWQFTGLPVSMSTPGVRFAARGWFRLWRELSRVLLRTSKGGLSLTDPRKFIDYPSWWRTALRDWASSLILDSRSLDRGYVKPEMVRSLVAQHMNGYRDHTNCLGLLVTFELWHRMFVD